MFRSRRPPSGMSFRWLCRSRMMRPFSLLNALRMRLHCYGMGIATDLQRKHRGKSGVGLPQIHPSFLCQFRQLTAPTRKAGRPSDRRCSFPGRSCQPPRAWQCPRRSPLTSARPVSSGSAAGSHLPRPHAPVTGSAMTCQSADDARRTSPE